MSTYIVVESIRAREPDAADRALELPPSELAFCEAWWLLRSGSYAEAAGLFAGLAQDHPEHGIVHLFLGLALAGAGEFEEAASTLELAHLWLPAIVSLRWDAVAHLGSVEQHAALRARLLLDIENDPAGSAARTVLALMGLLDDDLLDDDGALAEARRAAGEVALFGDESPLVRAILDEVARREGGRPQDQLERIPEARVARWFAAPSCETIADLGL